ncbi:MAG TPA: hypothetical protein VIN65_09050 [Candidatus Dormibacteraeota bacterium]
MRRQMTAVGATLTACGLIFGTAGLVASAATPQTSQANAALRYLYAQEGTDGSIAGSMGATEDTVISDADNGYDPATLKNSSSGTSAYDYLSAHVSTITTAGGAAKYILAWVAAGKPAAIDGTALLSKLNTATGAGGYLEPNGAFHNANPTVETANAFSQSLAVLADVAAGHLPLPANATRWLTCAQRSGGGFGYAINDTVTLPAPCGDTSSDSNDTAIILEALGAAGITSADSAAETYLRSIQQTSGGFGFSAGPTDPDSDAGVIQALVAVSQDPTGTAWTTAGGGNPLKDMESFADAQGSGGYVFPENSGPDAFTTSGIPQALALKPYVAATVVAAGTSPPPAVTTTPSPSPSPTATAAARGSAAITVPSTGASVGSGPGVGLSLALIGLGALALAAARLGRRPSSAP